MYQAKRRGRSRSELYTDAMRAESRKHKELGGELERALAAGQLRLAYQPIISTHSGRVAGAEALLRWDHPERGTLLPAQFLHLAEESGAIVPIGDWVTRQACLDTRAWLDAGLVDRGFSVHINVAARQLAEGTFVERVLATVRQMELSPHQLTFDFDEDTLNDQQPGNLRVAAGAAPLRCAAGARQLRHRHVVAHRAALLRGRRAEARRHGCPHAGHQRRRRPHRAGHHPAGPRARHAGGGRVGHLRRPAAPPAGARAATSCRATCSASPRRPTCSPADVPSLTGLTGRP